MKLLLLLKSEHLMTFLRCKGLGEWRFDCNSSVSLWIISILAPRVRSTTFRRICIPSSYNRNGCTIYPPFSVLLLSRISAATETRSSTERTLWCCKALLVVWMANEDALRIPHPLSSLTFLSRVWSYRFVWRRLHSHPNLAILRSLRTARVRLGHFVLGRYENCHFACKQHNQHVFEVSVFGGRISGQQLCKPNRDYLGEVKTLVLLFIILKKLLVLTLLELLGILKPLLLLTTVDNSSSSSTDFLALAMTPASDVVGRLTWLCIWLLRSAPPVGGEEPVVLNTDSDTVLMRSMSPAKMMFKTTVVQDMLLDQDLDDGMRSLRSRWWSWHIMILQCKTLLQFCTFSTHKFCCCCTHLSPSAKPHQDEKLQVFDVKKKERKALCKRS